METGSRRQRETGGRPSSKDLRAGSRQPSSCRATRGGCTPGWSPHALLPGTQPELSPLRFCHTPYPSGACQIDTASWGRWLSWVP